MPFDMNELLANIRNNSISSLDLHKERVAQAKTFQSTAILKEGHNLRALALAVFPDGRIISGGAGDCADIQMWDAKSSHCIATLYEHGSSVTALVVLPDGRFVSGSTDTTLRVWDTWDTKSWHCIATLRESRHSSYVWALAVLPDGHIVSGYGNGTLRVWDVNTRKCLATLTGHTSAVSALAVLPDGRIVSSGGSTMSDSVITDGTLRVWDVNNQKCVSTLTGHTADVNALAVLPDGRIVSGSKDKTLRVWDVNTQKCVSTLTGHTAEVNALAVLPDGRIVSGSKDNTLRIWGATSSQCIATLTGYLYTARPLAVLPNGRIVSSSYDGTLCIWDGDAPVLSLADFDKLIMALKSNTSLKSLSFAYSNLSLAQVQAIADLLKVNSNLTSFDLSHTGINDAGAQLLIDALKTNTTLQSLTLSGNSISKTYKMTINELLSRNHYLNLTPVTTLQQHIISASPLKSVSQPPAALPIPPTLQAKALYDFTASAYEELSFQAGDVLEVLSQNSSGWWRCRLAGKEGLVPSNYIELISSNNVNKPLPSPNKLGDMNLLTYIIPGKELVYDNPAYPVGKGSFGEVFKGTWRHEPVAIKRLFVSQLSPAVAADFKKEASIMAQLQSDYIITLKGIVLDQQPFCLVMSWAANGSLYDVLHSYKDLPWILRQQIAWDISKGLSYLHHGKIVHRDLKSPNVLLNEHMQAKLCDFGLSTVRSETASKSSGKIIGTPQWMAPELFEDEDEETKNYDSEKSDIYSYGMVLWELVTRKLPFAQLKPIQIAMRVLKGQRETIPPDCQPSITKIIKQCWEQDSTKRPTADEVVNALKEIVAPEVKSISPNVSGQQPWQVDAKIKPEMKINTVSYHLLEPTEEDKEKIVSYYQQYPVPGCDIGRIQVIYSPGVDLEFELKLKKLQNRFGNPVFAPQWALEGQPEQQAWRKKINQQFEKVTAPYKDSGYPAVKLILAWHGSKSDVVPSILKTGYANLATTDEGFFGKGIYSSTEAEYSYRVFSSNYYQGDKGVLLLNWVSAYSAYPVIDSDMVKLDGKDKLTAKGNYGNYDMHIVPVAPRNPNHGYEINYDPCQPNQVAQYTEVVVFESAQCLPRYIVELQPTLPKPMPTPEEYLQLQRVSRSTFFKTSGIDFRKNATLLLHAAKHVYYQYLAKPYSLTNYTADWEFYNDGIVIPRPNHGLAHTLRVVHLLPLVVKAYEQHNNISIGKADIENLKLLLLFYVTGRRNDMGSHDYPEDYRKFRRASVEAFESYVKKYNLKFTLAQMKSYSEILINNGEPKDNLGKIVKICHNLDLMRCFEPAVYTSVCRNLSTLLGSNELIQKLINYTEQCIVATGDRINGLDGKQRSYDGSLFCECSQDVQACLDRLKAIPYPALTHEILTKPNNQQFNF